MTGLVKRNQGGTIKGCDAANMAAQCITNHDSDPPSDVIFYVVNVVDNNTECSHCQEGDLMTHSTV